MKEERGSKRKGKEEIKRVIKLKINENGKKRQKEKGKKMKEEM